MSVQRDRDVFCLLYFDRLATGGMWRSLLVFYKEVLLLMFSVCVYREMLLQMVCGTKPFVCFKAKDLLRTALRHFSKDLSWEQGDKYTSRCFMSQYKRHCQMFCFSRGEDNIL